MCKTLFSAMLCVAVITVQAQAQEVTSATSAPVSFAVYTRASTAASDMAALLDGLSDAQLAVLEKLNRSTASRLKRLPALVMPTTWTEDELAYSPFPREYAWFADRPNAIVVDQQAQAFAAYEYGQLVRWGPVSTGSRGQTPAGLFQLSWRSRGHRSSIDPSWYLEWYFNFIPSRGIAFHKYSLPGQAASHGCVRLLERDAEWLYHWGEAAQRGSPGTTVLVLGCPDRFRNWRSEDYLRTGVVLPASPTTATIDCSRAGAATSSTALRRTLR